MSECKFKYGYSGYWCKTPKTTESGPASDIYWCCASCTNDPDMPQHVKEICSTRPEGKFEYIADVQQRNTEILRARVEAGNRDRPYIDEREEVIAGETYGPYHCFFKDKDPEIQKFLKVREGPHSPVNRHNEKAKGFGFVRNRYDICDDCLSRKNMQPRDIIWIHMRDDFLEEKKLKG